MSQVFCPFRAIGLYCDSVPFALQKRGNETFIATSIEKSFQIYNCDKLNIVQVGEQHAKKIRAIAMSRMLTFTASGPDIFIFSRGKKVGALVGHFRRVYLLSILGDHLLSVGEDNQLKVWDFRNRLCVSTVNLPEYHRITALLHPDTYLNKVVIGTESGELQLWNFRTNKHIYTFEGWKSAVRSIEQSPAVDVVAIGLADGRIIVHNLKLDRTLFSFKQDDEVTSLTFRTDGHPVLASSSKSGTIALWDLEKQKLITIMRDVHNGRVVRAQFLANEPVMLTSGSDNSLKMWIFDQSDGSGRLLRSRVGHSAPPTKVKFYVKSSVLISAGLDRSLRMFSTVKERRSREFSQGHLTSRAKKLKHYSEEDLKLPPIKDFDALVTRQREWDNIVTCHQNCYYAYSWHTETFSLGKHKMRSMDPTRPLVTSVCLSACGNFALVGSQTGWIDKYNIQSGFHRGCYPPLPPNFFTSKRARKTYVRGHKGSVEGLVVDALNRMLISGSLDHTLKFWNFEDHTLIASVDVGAPINKLCLHKDSSLLAVVSDDFIIRIYDIETKSLVRRFEGHSGQLITDVSFSGDSRLLVSASGDGTVRLWDLPTGKCIDWFKVKNPIISLTFSPRGDFLATTHLRSRGIYLWVNQMYFSNVFLQPIPTEPQYADMPTIAGPLPVNDDDDNDNDNDNDDNDLDTSEENQTPNKSLKSVAVTSGNNNDNVNNKDNNNAMSRDKESNEDGVTATRNNRENDFMEEDETNVEDDVTPLDKELITLTSLPFSKWKTLINFDIVTARNKATRPAKAPEAPFFLRTLPGLEPKFVPSEENKNEIKEVSSRILNFSAIRPKTPFIKTLEEAENGETVGYTKAIEMLKKMSPAAIDFEIRSLSLENNFQELKSVLRMIQCELLSGKNFELIEAVLKVLLQVHRETLSQSTELSAFLTEIKAAHEKLWSKLQKLYHNNICLLSFFSNIQTM
jgi:U3 small nucleolar RNA-associated protein 21